MRKLEEEESTKKNQSASLRQEESCKTDEIQNNYSKAKETRQEIAPIQSEVDKVKRQLSVAARGKINHGTLRDKLIKFRDDLRKELRIEEREEQKARKKCRELGGGEELQPARNLLTIQAKIKVLEKKNTTDGIDETSLLEEYRDMKEDFEKQERKLKSIRGIVDKLEDLKMKRKENFMALRNCIARVIQRHFYRTANQMSQVDHCGLNMRHES